MVVRTKDNGYTNIHKRNKKKTVLPEKNSYFYLGRFRFYFKIVKNTEIGITGKYIFSAEKYRSCKFI